MLEGSRILSCISEHNIVCIPGSAFFAKKERFHPSLREIEPFKMSSDDEVVQKKKGPAFSALLDSSDDESSADEKPAAVPKKAGFASGAWDDSSDDSDGSEDENPAQKTAAKAPAPAPAPAKGGKQPAAKAKGKGKDKGGDDDDWEALLDAEAAKNATAAPAASASSAGKGKAAKGGKAEADTSAAAAAEAFLAQMKGKEGAPAAAAEAADGDEKDGAAGGGSKKDKKKKGKGGKGDEAATAAAASAPAPAPAAADKKMSAAARMALERQAAAREAEEKRKAAEDEERRRVDEENKKIEEEERRKAELKAKREADRKARKEAEIKAGTYKTKKQKEEAARVLARLDAMKSSGMKIEGFEAKRAQAVADLADAEADDAADAAADGAAGAADAAAAAEKKKTANLYGKKKEKGTGKSSDSPATTPAAAGSAGPVAAAADDWESAADAAASGPVAESWEDAAEVALAPPPAPAPAGAAAPAATATGVAAVATVKPQGYQAAKTLEDRIDESRDRREKRKEEALATRSGDRLRSPICVVLGHVDTGKTSLLDKIRRTNVQEGEAGGITQQIGATYFPMDRLRTATDKLNKELHLDYKVPGLLVIDTPGHEQFTNLRSRGSSLCDIAVLVIDIMHGLERQTIESINLLRQKKTPFVVALNKVDRMYGWKANPNTPIRETLAKQADYAVSEFETRTQQVLLQLAEQGLNAKLYYENDNFKKNVSVVPTSAFTGEGVPDLLMLLVQLTQQLMSHRLMFSPHVQATILEVKTIDGLGTTVDVVLVNGELHEGDTIVVCGMAGPIVTQIRALLTPPPLREMRVKSDYVHHKRIEAAMGVKIVAADLDKAVAGTEVLVVHPDDEIEDLKEEVMEDFEKIMKGFKRDTVGVYVQASTLGALEALLVYLRQHKTDDGTPEGKPSPVPVAQVGIGPLHKKDVVMASTMLEHKKEYATILAFDVKVTPEAQEAADKLGVRIFTADIIYHLTDQFDAYLKETLAKKQAAQLSDAVFPVVVKIIADKVFCSKDPILVGVDVIEGKLKIGTPLCVILPDDKVVKAGGINDSSGNMGIQVRKAGPNILDIGKVASIERDGTSLQEAVPGGPSVALKIEPANDAQRAIMYGRHFNHEQALLAHVSRSSIDILKENFRDQMSKENWKTVIRLKEMLKIE